MTIGYMSFANIFPLFYHLEQNKSYQFVKGVPSILNNKLRAGELDVSPVSSLEYIAKPDYYRILPSIGICANKKVQSVILFSNYPITELAGRKIFRTPDSLASVNLLKIIFEHFYHIDPVYTNDENEKDAYLLIGDRALRHYHSNTCPYVYDLAEVWYQETGLPFVFSLWLATPNAAVLPLYEELTRIVPTIYDRREFYADEYLKRFPNSFTKEQLVEYWHYIYYTIGEKELEGLKLYYTLSGYKGDLRWLD